MRRTNIASPSFHYDENDPAAFRSGIVRPGRELGAVTTGMSMYELPPGRAICPYHYEYGEEEWLLVLAGTPTLRHPEGEERLEPWDVVFFAPGPGGAHGVRNETDEAVRVVMFSSILFPGATVYPDSDKIGIWPDRESRADKIIVRRASGVDYWDGEA